MDIKKGIEIAIKGGWKKEIRKKHKREYNKHENRHTSELNPTPQNFREYLGDIDIYQALLDPKFWKALGKSEGWKNCVCLFDRDGCIYGGGDAIGWKHRLHQFIDNLAQDKSLEESFKNATK